MKILAILILGSAMMFSQSAKVQPLTEDETKQIKDLFDQKIAIESKIDDFKSTMRDKYLRYEAMKDSQGWYHFCLPEEPKFINSQVDWRIKGQTQYCDVRGWVNGFEFSEDFKYIVPTPSK